MENYEEVEQNVEQLENELEEVEEELEQEEEGFLECERWRCFLLFCDKFLLLHFVKIIFPAIFPKKVVISFSIFRYII